MCTLRLSSRQKIEEIKKVDKETLSRAVYEAYKGDIKDGKGFSLARPHGPNIQVAVGGEEEQKQVDAAVVSDLKSGGNISDNQVLSLVQ